MSVPPKISEGESLIQESILSNVQGPASTADGAVPDQSELTTTELANVVLTPPKSKEELIAERALKRAERKAAIREKAEEHKRAGDVSFASKNYKAAYPQYLEAIQLWGSDTSYYISLAATYRKLEWYEEAAHAATRALTLDPKNSEARYVRGVARLEQRLLKPAQTDFETVLEHDPSHLLARAALTEVIHFISTSTHLGSHELGPDPVEEVVKDLDFGFPHYDYEALEVASVSDSSDCNHVGNGVPCRFYNHDGCARGTACVFSHAPDEKSVRDDLGKNVCIYYLLDSCKFGAAKCVYSHSKDALPNRGWWTSPEKVAKVKSVLEVAEKKAREQRHIENERWKAHVKAMKAASKPPKSAGVNGKKSEKKPEAPKVEEPTTEGAVELKADAPKKEGSRPKNHHTHSSKKTKASPNEGNAQAPVENSSISESVPQTTSTNVSTDKTAPTEFTDYQLNVPPAGVKPTTPEVTDPSTVLSY